MAKAREIAEWLGVELPADADGEAELFAVSSIDAATWTSVVFATDAKTLNRAFESDAGIILAKNGLRDGPRVILVPDARFAFAKVAQRLSPKDVGG